MIKQTFLASIVDLPLIHAMGNQASRLLIKNAFYLSLRSCSISPNPWNLATIRKDYLIRKYIPQFQNKIRIITYRENLLKLEMHFINIDTVSN